MHASCNLILLAVLLLTSLLYQHVSRVKPWVLRHAVLLSCWEVCTVLCYAQQALQCHEGAKDAFLALLAIGWIQHPQHWYQDGLSHLPIWLERESICCMCVRCS